MTQPDPFRLKVLKGLTTSLEYITVAHGFHNDLSGKVFRGRSVYGDDDPVPMVSILEPPIPLDAVFAQGQNPNSVGNWELLLQGFVKDDRKNPTDPAHHLMADVKKHLVFEKQRDRGNNIFGLGGRVTEIFIGQGSVRPPDTMSNKAFFWLILTLGLAEKLDNPYE